MKKIFIAVSVALLAVQAQAASVIDTATKTAISSGFTNLQDTILDLIVTAMPFIVAGSVLMAAPQIVKGMIHLASRK